MPRICYDSTIRDRMKRNASHMAIVTHANTIIAEYQAQGFDLTLRQLYYQFVSRALLPNKPAEYNRLGTIIVDARLAGMIDWSAIVDRTRNLEDLAHWDNPESIIEAVSTQFRTDKWATQPHRVEVWIEKEALAGVFANVCQELDVPYFCCRGYTSVSEMWSAGRRLMRYRQHNQTPIILHFGDHDPSGTDMTRDVVDRLALFSEGTIEVRRLALNKDQIDEYNPPPNPAKLSDSRSTQYIAMYGDESWELDALEPRVLADLVRDAVTTIRDDDAWSDAEEEETTGRTQLGLIAERYTDVVNWLEE